MRNDTKSHDSPRLATRRESFSNQLETSMKSHGNQRFKNKQTLIWLASLAVKTYVFRPTKNNSKQTLKWNDHAEKTIWHLPQGICSSLCFSWLVLMSCRFGSTPASHTLQGEKVKRNNHAHSSMDLTDYSLQMHLGTKTLIVGDMF
ncbi:hypothetical protein ILYODFUR_013168 [Ilyodon furcidens]|uniref:Uncharacterized protein n=1 Tax=Ilyodon furcidens TaxID=33524 RepID=A0ABV0U6E6_9TELE